MNLSHGEENLTAILASLSPVLDPNVYIFAKVDLPSGDAAHSVPSILNDIYLRGVIPISTFIETEGLTLVVPESEKEKIEDLVGFQFSTTPFSRITLQVHSSLDAVGLTAIVSTKLAEGGISANVIAAFYHDHFFVQSVRAEEALIIIRSISTSA